MWNAFLLVPILEEWVVVSVKLDTEFPLEEWQIDYKVFFCFYLLLHVSPSLGLIDILIVLASCQLVK